MTSARLPANEPERLEALRQLHILDTAPEAGFDDLVQLAAQICEVPTALMSLVDQDRQWFKARVGLGVCETSRDSAFCAHAILEAELLIVPDALQDDRFADNPLVTGPPHFRFYAGVPIRTGDGLALGTLCVLDTRPRQLSDTQRMALTRLARQLGLQLELRRTALDLKAAIELQRQSEASLQSLLTDLPAAVFECDSRGWCTRVNAHWTNLTGLSATDATGMGWLRAIHPADRTRVAAEWAAASAAGSEFISEFRYLRPDGETPWIEGRSKPRHAADGSISGLIGTAIDITARRQAEVARRQSEMRLAHAVAATNDGLWDWDIPSSTVYFSPRCCQMLGYGPNEVPGDVSAWKLLLHPDDYAMVFTAVEAQFRGETEFYQTEQRLRMKDGSWRWILARGKVVERDAEGRPLRMTGTHTDISRERDRASALHSSEAKLRGLFELSPVGIALCNLDGRFVDANDAYLGIVDYSRSELLNLSHVEVTSAEYRPRQAAWMRALATTGRYGPHEKEYLRRDGSRVPVLVDGVPVTDADGTHRLWLIVKDITESRRAIEALEQARFMLAETIANAPIAMAMLDTDMRYLAYSRKWLDDYGLTGQDLLGRSHYEVFPTIPDRWKALHRRALAGEELSNPEDTFEQPNGERTFLRWAIHPWRESTGSIGGMIMVTDVVTDLVRARQEAIESTRLKADFLASMSHEIRTPMNGVIGMTGLLLDTSLSAEQRECAETIRASSESLLTIINDILDFSKIEAEKLVIEPVPFDVHRVVEDVGDLLMPRIQDKRLELVVRYGEDVPRCVVGDPGRIRQILTNLVGNAVKFTERGHIFVDVTRMAAAASTTLRFEVSDTGIGIPADKLGYVFEKFMQADSSTTRKFGGTGLGLAISRQLTKLMGGTIGVSSELGAGSTFWFTLPLTDASPDAPLVPERLPSTRRVLVVDDVELTGRILKEQIEHLGPVADAVASGARALEQLRSATAEGRPYDAVLLDFLMPEMDGEAVARAIGADPALAGTRLVLASGMMSRPPEEWLRDLGFAAFLRKPVRLEELAPALLRAFDRTTTIAARPVSENGPAPAASMESARTAGPRVLVVDDNSVNLKVAARMLGKLGCRVDVAGNGAEAVELVRKLPYAVVFMDCMMPEMDGYEATAAIRAMPGPVARTPIVAMTANAMQGDREHCLAAGMDDYLSKPVRHEQLHQALTRWAPEPATTSELPPIDDAVLEGFRQLQEDGAPDVVHEFIDLFLEDLPVRREAILMAVNEGDTERVRAGAHALKSSAAYIGAAELARICKDVEMAARSGDLVTATRRGAALASEADRVAAFLLTRRGAGAARGT